MFENTLLLFVCPSKFLHISVVSSFAWDLQWSQEKTKTMLMRNLEGQTKSIMVFSKMAYCNHILFIFFVNLAVSVLSLCKKRKEYLLAQLPPPQGSQGTAKDGARSSAFQWCDSNPDKYFIYPLLQCID